MSESVEAMMYAGGGAIVPTENFVPTRSDTKFTSPSGLCVTPAGDLLVSDHRHRGIFVIEEGRTRVVTDRAQEGGREEENTEAIIHSPHGLACLDDGSILVADMHDNTIKKLKHERVSVFAGNGQRGGEDGKFQNARFDKPKSLCLTPRGDLLVTEVGSHRIRLLIMDYGGVIVTVAGEGPKGYKEGGAEKARFSHPSGICCVPLDPSLVYLTYRPRRMQSREPSDLNSQLDHIDDHKDDSEYPTDPFSAHLHLNDLPPKSTAHCDSSASDSNRSSTSPSDGPVEASSAPSNFDNPQSDLNDLNDLLTDEQDTNAALRDDLLIFVSDTQNHRIRMIHNGIVSSLAGNGRAGLADGPCNLASFDHPVNIVMVHHAILVADNRNDVIRLIDLDSDLVRTVQARHSPTPLLPSFTSDEKITPESVPLRVERPSVMALNEAGELFVACEFETHAEIHLLSRFQICSPLSPSTPPVSPRSISNTLDTPIESSDGAATLSTDFSASLEPSGDALSHLQGLHNVPRPIRSAGSLGHIEMLVARERSKSVDSGIASFRHSGLSSTQSSSKQLADTPPATEAPLAAGSSSWGIFSKLSRMLSLDESTMKHRVESLLERIGVGGSTSTRDVSMKNDAIADDISDHELHTAHAGDDVDAPTPITASIDHDAKDNQKKQAGKVSVDEEGQDPDEIVSM